MSLAHCMVRLSVQMRSHLTENSFSLHKTVLWSSYSLKGFIIYVCFMTRKDFGQICFYKFLGGHSIVTVLYLE
jgi:hypothetical protein